MMYKGIYKINDVEGMGKIVYDDGIYTLEVLLKSIIFDVELYSIEAKIGDKYVYSNDAFISSIVTENEFDLVTIVLNLFYVSDKSFDFPENITKVSFEIPEIGKWLFSSKEGEVSIKEKFNAGLLTVESIKCYRKQVLSTKLNQSRYSYYEEYKENIYIEFNEDSSIKEVRENICTIQALVSISLGIGADIKAVIYYTIDNEIQEYCTYILSNEIKVPFYQGLVFYNDIPNILEKWINENKIYSPIWNILLQDFFLGHILL